MFCCILTLLISIYTLSRSSSVKGLIEVAFLLEGKVIKLDIFEELLVRIFWGLLGWFPREKLQRGSILSRSSYPVDISKIQIVVQPWPERWIYLLLLQENPVDWSEEWMFFDLIATIISKSLLWLGASEDMSWNMKLTFFSSKPWMREHASSEKLGCISISSSRII